MTTWASWLEDHRVLLQRASPWQWIFAEQVLSRVTGLEPAWVTTEYAFLDAAGRARRADFAIHGPEGVRLIVEVDGYDKAGTGGGMSQADFDDFLSRQNSLVLQGWQLLRFSNVTLRERPTSCISQLEALLQLPELSGTTEKVEDEAGAYHFVAGLCPVHGVEALPVRYGWLAGPLKGEGRTVLAGGCDDSGPSMACPKCWDLSRQGPLW